jgi:hypothetical protein
MKDTVVTIRLTSDEALVLDSLLSRLDTGDDSAEGRVVSDPSERAALWALSAALERDLPEPLRSDYDRLLAEAQTRLREMAGL